MITTPRERTDRHTISVGLGELAVTKDEAVSLVCFGLGSCICLCAYDPVSRVSGMAHIVLPESKGNDTGKTGAKYADVAVSMLLEDMQKLGALKSRMVIKLAGGAQMIESEDYNRIFDVGVRNLEITIKTLSREGLGISGSDTGGKQGRSVWMFVDSGTVLVKKTGQEPEEI